MSNYKKIAYSTLLFFLMYSCRASQPSQSSTDEEVSTPAAVAQSTSDPITSGSPKGLRLIPTSITSSTAVCGSSSAPSCLGNGIGFACLITTENELGICARSSDSSSSCRCEQFSKFANPEPKVANATCATTQTPTSCSGEDYGTDCSTVQGGAGYCAPSDFKNRYCGCARYVDPATTTNIGSNGMNGDLCSTYRPLDGGSGSLISRVNRPGYADNGTLKYPNGKTFLLRNSGYTNDNQVYYPNGEIMMLASQGSNNKTIYWPNGEEMVLARKGNSNDGTVYRQDGSTWLLRNSGYTNDRQRFGLPLENYSDGTVEVKASLTSSDSALARTLIYGSGWRIQIALDGSSKDVQVTECIGNSSEGASTPSASALTAQYVQDSEVQLVWTSGGAGTTGFLLSYNEGNTPPTDCLRGATSLGLSTSTKVSGLKPSTNYSFRMCSIGINGSLGGSTVLSLKTIDSLSAAPTQPSSFAAKAQSAVSVSLTWVDTSTNEDRFEIERSIDDITFVAVTSPTQNITSFTDTGLTPGTRYTYRIRSVNSAGFSPWVSGSATTSSPVTPPLPPIGLSVISPSSSTVTLAWQDGSSNEGNFEIEKAVGSGGFGDRRLLPANTTSFSDSGLAAGTSYQYRVRSINSAGASAYITGAVTTSAGPSATRVSAVEISLPGTNAVLSLAEVQVISNAGERIQSQGVASQSSVASPGEPGRANDGNTNGSFPSNSVTHTKAENNPWWRLAFTQSVPVTSVVVWNRTDCCKKRLNGAVVKVFDTQGAVVFTGSIPNGESANSFTFDIPAR